MKFETSESPKKMKIHWTFAYMSRNLGSLFQENFKPSHLEIFVEKKDPKTLHNNQHKDDHNRRNRATKV